MILGLFFYIFFTFRLKSKIGCIDLVLNVWVALNVKNNEIIVLLTLK